jgi:uncharacterized protein (TIGR03083 family)
VAKTLEFSDLLRLIDERTSAFRAVVAAAPSLDVPVPSCPGWTLLDLVQHLGKGRRRWAAIVAAGPAEAPPAGTHPKEAPDGPAEREALLAWLAEGSELLLSALRAAGPDRGCWTWWDRSESPQTSGAVARHQVQEVAVHTYDAQLALGTAQPLPDEVALDGVDEFLSTCCAGSYPWPYDACTVDYQVTGGPTWRLSLAADIVRTSRFPAEAPDPAGASIRDTASELVLFLYGRHPLDAMKVEGDPHLFELLIEWDPDA